VIDLIMSLCRHVFKFCIAIPYRFGLVSEKQRELFLALGKYNENHNVAHSNLNISRGAMRNRLSRAFLGFMEDLDLYARADTVKGKAGVFVARGDGPSSIITRKSKNRQINDARSCACVSKLNQLIIH